jgi:hypothetical protein
MELVKSDRYVPQSGKEIVDSVSSTEGTVGFDGYGLRTDGTPKGRGWLGKISGTGDNAGNDMTEYSVGIEWGGKEHVVPSIVPTLTQEEIDHIASGKGITRPIMLKAMEHAKARMAEGKSVWSDTPRYVPSEAGFIDHKTGKPYVPNEISTNTGKPLATAEEEFAARRGLLSDLSDSAAMLSGDYDRDPRWQMAAWLKAKDLPTRSAIYKGLANDIRSGLKFNPETLKDQYHGLHAVPEKYLTQADRIAFNNASPFQAGLTSTWTPKNPLGVEHYPVGSKTHIDLNTLYQKGKYESVVPEAAGHETAHMLTNRGASSDPVAKSKEAILRGTRMEMKKRDIPIDPSAPSEISATGVEVSELSKRKYHSVGKRRLSDEEFKNLYEYGLDDGLRWAKDTDPAIFDLAKKNVLDKDVRMRYSPNTQDKIKQSLNDLFDYK